REWPFWGKQCGAERLHATFSGRRRSTTKSPAPGESGALAHATSDPDNVTAAMREESKIQSTQITLVTFAVSTRSFVGSCTENLRLLTQESPQPQCTEEHRKPCSRYCGPS